MRKKGLMLLAGILFFSVAAIFSYSFFGSHSQLANVLQSLDELGNDPDEIPVPAPVKTSQNEILSEPSSTDALGGYDVLIADRGNNRLIEVTPDKKIVWEYDFNLSRPGLGADDAFFADNGSTIIVNLELYHVIQQINYQDKNVTWSYGISGTSGSGPNFLNRPDDAEKLPNGDVIVADIRNCRVIEISPDKKIVHQYGSKPCSNRPGHLDKPNSATPLDNGHILISSITGSTLVELDQNWKEILSLKLPLQYPSDPRPTKAGNILVADYSNSGRIIEITRDGTVAWDYAYTSGSLSLKRPSLAIELPNGNILTNDDFNHRVIVIDKKTKTIVWQYGVTGKPGNAWGQLNVPDGVDIIMRNQQATSSRVQTYSVGYLTRHPSDLLGQSITISGYLLKKENGYAMFSDENSGGISTGDLPVSGNGVSNLIMSSKYLLTGKLIDGGLKAINRNPYHFELSTSSSP